MSGFLQPPRTLIVLPILLFAMLIATPHASPAQWIDTTLRPIRPTYGIPIDEFAIIGTHYKWQPNDPYFTKHDSLWEFIHSMGFHIMNQSLGVDYNQVSILDEILHSTYRDRDTTVLSSGFPLDRLIISSAANPSWKAGFGREIEFYPFDSVQTQHWVWTFVKRNGGVTDTNGVERDPANILRPAREQVYATSNTTTGDTVAWNIAFNYDPVRQTFRYEQDLYDDNHNSQNSSQFFESARSSPGARQATTYYLATRAHLFPDGVAQSSDAVFRIEVWHEVAKQKGYLNTNLTLAVAQQDTAILIDTFQISKGEIIAGQPSIDLLRYRTIVRGTDLEVRRIDGGPGPLHTGQPTAHNGSRRVDIRVFWTGAEKAALRSVALRDSTGELLVGSTQFSVDYRQSLYDQWARQVLGAGLKRDSLRARPIIRVESGTEPFHNPTEFAGFNVVNRIFKDSFNLAPYRQSRSESMQPGDSVPAFEWDLPAPWFYELGTQDETYHYLYINDIRDTVSRFVGIPAAGYSLREKFEAPEHQIPTLPEHNGGRFYLPVLGLTGDSVERYESTLQRAFFGYYDPVPNSYFWPRNDIRGHMQLLGVAASGARKYGRRLIPHVGLVQAMVVRDTTGSTAIDTIVSHRPESSEIRCLTNLSLAYGARGIWWWLLATKTGLLGPSPYNPTNTVTTNEDKCCLGVGGFVIGDTLRDYDPAFTLTNDGGATRSVIFPNYYLGWRQTTREVRWLNQSWLNGPDAVTQELMKLRWRDSYSIHHTVEWPMAPGALFHDTAFRPLPSNELVKSVTSRYPGRPAADSAHRTFVEIGLFETIPGYDITGLDTVRNVLKDANYAFVVNRRTFERPGDISSSLPRGRAMDSLAETRQITLKFNLPHPISDSNGYRQYAYLHVTEMYPDRSPLPWPQGSAARVPLDTIVYADSAVNLTLGPGRGALLRITFAQPDLARDTGDTRFNNQRKLVFDGRRYHNVFWKREVIAPGPIYDFKVFYRRSAPMTATTGSILWEPFPAIALSDAIQPMDTARSRNAFPSLTLRTENGDTVVYVIWTSHNTQGTFVAKREVLLRAIHSPSESEGGWVPLRDVGPIEVVGRHWGVDSTQWGTPVISRFRSGELYAYSDSLGGITVRIRRDSIGVPEWWKFNRGHSPTALLVPAPLPALGKYPTVETFGKITGGDSSYCGIAWQSPVLPMNGQNLIIYAQLQDRGTATAPLLRNWTALNNGLAGLNFHPSIGERHGRNRVEDVVVWESFDTCATCSGLKWDNWLNAQTITTPWRDTSGVSIVGISSVSNLVKQNVQASSSVSDSVYPNVASLNHRYDPLVTTSDSTRFSIVLQTSNHALYSIRSAFQPLVLNTMSSYAYGGLYPNASAAPIRQVHREATVYKISSGSTGFSQLRTTRQYFARLRPTGYVADGREVMIRINDSLHTGMTASIFDVWIANDTIGRAVPMSNRNPDGRTDTLGLAQMLLNSSNFRASDSIEIGWLVTGKFHGDSSAAGSASLVCRVQLMDSVTGAVVQTLDSFVVSTSQSRYDRRSDTVVDLLSGTYYLALQVDTVSIVVPSSLSEERYPVAEISAFIDEEHLGKLRRTSASTGPTARLSAQPNPFSGSTDIRFSVVEAGPVVVMVYDRLGSRVATLVDDKMVEPGRYEIGFDGSALAPGTYLIDLRTGSTRLSEKVVIVR